eukprot:COSAG02_NODE_1451_length_12556_cov_3.624258_2_plen_465_part_00
MTGLAKPSYTIDDMATGCSALAVKIHLPGVTAAEQVSLDVGASQIVVTTLTCARLEVDLPRAVMPEHVTARFKKKSGVLHLELPMFAPATDPLLPDAFTNTPSRTGIVKPNATFSDQEVQRDPRSLPEPEPEPQPEPEPEPEYEPDPEAEPDSSDSPESPEPKLEPDSLTKLLGSLGMSQFGRGVEAIGGASVTPATFVEGERGLLHPDFAAAAAKMKPLLRRVLIDDVVDADDQALLEILGNGPDRLITTRALLRRKRAIRPAGCAALRAAVDSDRNMESDSVDNKAQHQQNITIGRLTELIGHQDVDALWQLADDLLTLQRSEAEAIAEAAGEEMPASVAEKVEVANGGYKVDMFVRRYTRETRPWIPFHYDNCNITINVALSPDTGHEGGRLHAILGGRHRVISREEGEATAHGDDIMHCVSAMRSGVRYSLIMFFFALQDTHEARAHETLPGGSTKQGQV